MDALLLYSRDIFDEFHQWGLIHEPFGFKSSDLTDCPEGGSWFNPHWWNSSKMSREYSSNASINITDEIVNLQYT